MQISRRSFLKFCGVNAVALGLSSGVLGKLEYAFAASRPKVIWLQGASCSGCTISTLNLVQDSGITDAHELLIETVDMRYHGTIMGLAGDAAQDPITNPPDNFILVVEGAVPTAYDGAACVLWEKGGNPFTMKDALIALAAKASAVVCAGTCASFGGIPAAGSNPAQVKNVTDVLSEANVTPPKLINVPGCPVHPERLVLTLAQVLASQSIKLLPEGKGYEGENWRCHICHDHAQQDLPSGHKATYGQSCTSPACHGDNYQNFLPLRHPALDGTKCITCHNGSSGIQKLPGGHDPVYGQSCTYWACHGEDYKNHLPGDHPTLTGAQCVSCHDDDDDDDDDDYDFSSLYSSPSSSVKSSAQSCHSCHSHIPTNEVMLYGTPFDNKKVPAKYFKDPICPCSRKTGGKATSYGTSDKCQYELGCRGQTAFADCPSRKWHGGVSWCMGANALCSGCVHPSFPDQSNRALLAFATKDQGVEMDEPKEPAAPQPPSSDASMVPIRSLLLD